jgi:hypothetical protein
VEHAVETCAVVGIGDIPVCEPSVQPLPPRIGQPFHLGLPRRSEHNTIGVEFRVAGACTLLKAGLVSTKRAKTWPLTLRPVTARRARIGPRSSSGWFAAGCVGGDLAARCGPVKDATSAPEPT